MFGRDNKSLDASGITQSHADNLRVVWLAPAASTPPLDGFHIPNERIYRLSLVVPLAVPLLAASLQSFSARLPEWLVWVLLYTTFSGIIGGIPYLFLIGLLLLWANGKTDAQFKRALALSPILMLPVVAFIIVVALLAEAWLKPENAVPVSNSLLMLLGLVPFILGFGYLYVLLVFSGAAILKRRGLLVPSSAI